MELEASDRVNIDEHGRALPTRVALYQLTDVSRMTAASFAELGAHAQATLGETRVSDEELILYPGQVSVHRFKRAPRADYVVAVAHFREPEGAGWQTVQAWPAASDPCRISGVQHVMPNKLRVRIFLEDNRIESLTNFADFPRPPCSAGTRAPCVEIGEPAHELRRNRHLRTFEEDPREPDEQP